MRRRHARAGHLRRSRERRRRCRPAPCTVTGAPSIATSAVFEQPLHRAPVFCRCHPTSSVPSYCDRQLEMRTVLTADMLSAKSSESSAL